MPASEGNILKKINSPEELKKLPESDLPQLCHEIRDYIIAVNARNPGHLGASLGAVELAVAIHYVFDTPNDKLVWDVGHQAYAHKILTGRKEAFKKNRTQEGTSGFPKREESEYDAFGTGHSSTSVSAALGMAMASKLKKTNGRQHIAVIGDASIASGMAMEAMNNAGVSNANILVILNDNGIAIDKNVGAISNYLTKIVSSKAYNKFKDKVWYMLGGGTKYGKNTREIVKQLGAAAKLTLLKGSNFFESFGFRYFGPIDGHDVVRMVKLLRDLKEIPGPKFLHTITTKGKGLKAAEKDQTKYHSPGPFNVDTGEIIQIPCPDVQPPKFQTVFGRTIIELAEKNDKIVGITPAMPTGSSLNIMMNKMPDRAFDVGIAEQHAVTFAAGLAADGMVPFCNIYSTFMQRAYDQLIHDVAIQKLQVVFCLDRGGLVGEDGTTHHGTFDLAYLRCVPEMTICSPMNEVELRNMMYTAQLDGMGTTAIRYPRGRGVMPEWKLPLEKLEPGKGRLLAEGGEIAFITIGPVGNYVNDILPKLLEEGISASHVDIRYLKPLDEALLHRILKQHDRIITVEDGTIVGGLGSAVMEFIHDNNYKADVVRLGVPDRFIKHGTVEELHRQCGYDADSILKRAKLFVDKRVKSGTH
jgi:1-deoxy-D-xylulose-5-phosphate synthase